MSPALDVLDAPPCEVADVAGDCFPADVVALVYEARRHRATGPEDECAGCGWHWPCPIFFAARRGLIRVGVPPVWWAAPLPVPRPRVSPR